MSHRVIRRCIDRRARWWPWSVPPRPGSPISASGWRSPSTPRSSTPTRCSSTPAWTSAPPSSRRTSARGVPHHLLDVWPVTRTASVVALPAPRPARSSTTCSPAVARWWSSGGPGSTSAPCSTTSTSRGPTRTYGLRWRPSWPRVGSAQLHARLAGADPAAATNDRPGERSTHRAGAGGRRAATAPTPRPCRSRGRTTRGATHVGLSVPRPSWPTGSRTGSTGCGRPAWSRRPGCWPESVRPARGTHRQPRPRLRAGPAGARRRASTRRGHASTRSARPGASPAARSPGSAATTADPLAGGRRRVRRPVRDGRWPSSSRSLRSTA